MMSYVQLGWIAGFIEGDGYCFFQKTTPGISIRQCNRQSLEQVMALIGGRIYPMKMSALGRKPIFEWRLWGARALGVMMTIYPVMSVEKQGQIRAIIAKWKLVRGTHGEQHAKVRTKDVDALEAMRLVIAGTSMDDVARQFDVDRSLLQNWLAGKWRKNLLETLQAEGYHSRWVSAEGQCADGRRVPQRLADSDALAAMHRVQNGESMNTVAASIGVNHGVISQWLSGAHRPGLLAQLTTSMKKEDSLS